jgi:hypothetical protein
MKGIQGCPSQADYYLKFFISENISARKEAILCSHLKTSTKSLGYMSGKMFVLISAVTIGELIQKMVSSALEISQVSSNALENCLCLGVSSTESGTQELRCCDCRARNLLLCPSCDYL